LIEIAFGESKRLLDAQPCPPHDHDERAQAAAVRTVTGGAHDGDDLLYLRWVGGVAQALVSGRVTGVESRQRRRRPTPTSAVEQKLGHDPSSGS
jgi:hypothetical protein